MPTQIYEISQDGKGICGFTSMAQMLIDTGKLTLDEFKGKYATSTGLADAWLQNQIQHDQSLKEAKQLDVAATSLKQSLLFTGDFGVKYEMPLDDLLSTKTWDWNTKPGFALIPESICDYVLRGFGLKMGITPYEPAKTLADLWKDTDTNLGNGIYGIKRKEGAGPNKDQIQHYVYIDKTGNLMTWTKQSKDAFNALAAKNFVEVVVKLTPLS